MKKGRLDMKKYLALLLALVMALTGNVDIPGGLMLRGRDPLDRPAKRLAANLGEQAYRHKDVYGAYPEAGQGVVQRIQQRAARPAENGIRPGGAATVHPDVASMTRAQREALERRVLHGAQIEL